MTDPGATNSGYVVTGGARGVGRAIATRLAAGGARVVIVDRSPANDWPGDAVEGDAADKSLFALANREINLRIAEVYKTLPPPALSRFGEILSRTDEVV